MSELQMQAINYIEKMPDSTLQALLKIMVLLSQPGTNKSEAKPVPVETKKRIGIASGRNLYAPDYDLDEYNGEIARMFGVE